MKYIVTTFLISGLIFSASANDQSNKNKEAVYSDLLSRFDCVLGPNVNDPKWICNDKAPKGWGKYYSNKLKKEKYNRKQLVKK